MEKFNKILKNVLIFLVIFMAINYLIGLFTDKDKELVLNSGNLIFETTENEYSRSEKITVRILNDTKETITIPNECPGEPFKVSRFENNEWIVKTSNPELSCANTAETKLESGKEIEIPYTNWNNDLFSDMGRFKIEFTTKINEEEKTLTTNEFTVTKEGLFRQLSIGLFYRPIYNGLIFLAKIVPGHDLGFAIILLTIIIRTILLIPSQKAMKSQKRMQDIQPRLTKIKEKYKGDQQKIAMETMAVWKETKINPMSSCLPMLMQFPFLIALFYVIQGGLNPDNTHLLYQQYSDFKLTDININFLGILDLTKANLYVLPLIIGGLQFIQMKMAMGKKLASQEKNEMAMAGNMMLYIMPVMIAVFTASLPAGVGIYWGASTIYGIIQQVFVNKQKTKNDEPTVKVIS